jgi:hypothetical protein
VASRWKNTEVSVPLDLQSSESSSLLVRPLEGSVPSMRRFFSSISNSRAIVDFRNLLAHDYGAVDDDAVFGLVYSDLIVLKAEVGELLDDCHDAN